ncbi:alpha/beta hydrolase [Limibacter armeniacum]|uniref:alpha/beta fold hydrolase n=1 Tax=Limibacter armeniacum TaxID=466084 RepID=UPI002FE6C24D
MEPQQWKATGSFFHYNGHQVFFKKEGTGEPLLLIHGFPTASWDWHKLWHSLSQQFQVITVDLLGYGFSDKPKNYPYSLKDQADLIESFMKELKLGHTHILAHDYGDTVAQELLARQKEQKCSFEIKSVCFLNGGMFPETTKPRKIQKLLTSKIGPIIAPFLNKRRLSKNFHEIFGPDTKPTIQEINHYWELITYNKGKYVIPYLSRYQLERKKFRNRWVEYALTGHKTPICMINGIHDPISGINIASRFKEVTEDAEVYLLEGIGHYPQMEAPEKVLSHYYSWLKAFSKKEDELYQK